MAHPSKKKPSTLIKKINEKRKASLDTFDANICQLFTPKPVFKVPSEILF